MPNTPADLETAVKEAVLAVLPEIVKLVSAELDRRRGSGSGGGGGGGGGQKPNIAELAGRPTPNESAARVTYKHASHPDARLPLRFKKR